MNEERNSLCVRRCDCSLFQDRHGSSKGRSFYLGQSFDINSHERRSINKLLPLLVPDERIPALKEPTWAACISLLDKLSEAYSRKLSYRALTDYVVLNSITVTDIRVWEGGGIFVNNLISRRLLSALSRARDGEDNHGDSGCRDTFLPIGVGFRTSTVSRLSRVHARDTKSSISPRHVSLRLSKQRVYRVTVTFMCADRGTHVSRVRTDPERESEDRVYRREEACLPAKPVSY